MSTNFESDEERTVALAGAVAARLEARHDWLDAGIVRALIEHLAQKQREIYAMAGAPAADEARAAAAEDGSPKGGKRGRPRKTDSPSPDAAAGSTSPEASSPASSTAPATPPALSAEAAAQAVTDAGVCS